MSKTGAGPAFPSEDQFGAPLHPGMTYRQWLIGRVVQGYLSNGNVAKFDDDNLAACFKLVDAVLVALDAEADRAVGKTAAPWLNCSCNPYMNTRQGGTPAKDCPAHGGGRANG